VAHIAEAKMLQVLRDEVGLTDEEMAHLLSCAECIRLLTQMMFPE
jgi:hypothetical protein